MRELIALALACLVGARGSDGLTQYAAAIVQTTDNVFEQRVLLVVAFGENWFHLHSQTPPFGVTDYAAHHPGEEITIKRGASLALRFLRRHRAQCGSWDRAFGRYTTGHCVSTRHSRWMVRRLLRILPGEMP